MRIKIAAGVADSSQSSITFSKEVPFSVIAAVMSTLAGFLPAIRFEIESENPLPRPVTSTSDLTVYGANAKSALDSITTQPVVLPPPEFDASPEQPNAALPVVPGTSAQYFEYVEVPNAPIQGEFGSAVADAKTLALVPVEPTTAQKAAQAALATVKPEVLAKQVGEKIASVQELAAKLPPDNPLAQAIAAPTEAPKKRTRKAAGSSEVEHPADNREIAGSMPASPTAPDVSSSADIQESQQSLTLPAQPVAPPERKKMLSDEEMAQIRPRLTKYRNQILTNEGGMSTVLNFGNVEDQLKAFCKVFRPDKPIRAEWNFQDWLKLLEFFDDGVKNIGARGLVRYIQQGIGLVPNPDDGSEPRVRK